MNFLDEPKIPGYPYPELRDVLRAFVDKITVELGQNLVGVYLVGLLASGDFDLDSDVDFLVVIHPDLTAANRSCRGARPVQHLVENRVK